jgi:chaperonin GroEL
LWENIHESGESAMSQHSDIYALLIGINDYESEAVRRLQFAVADVVAFRQFLIQRMGLNPDNSVLLSYPAVESARTPRRAEVLRALDRFSAAPMRPEDTFVLYFAGHGFASDDVSFLLTADSDPGSSNLLGETAISLATIKRFIQGIRAGQQLLILDACRNEPTTLTRDTGSSFFDAAMARDIAAVVRGNGGDQARPDHTAQARAILSACWQGQVSYEYRSGGQSWFCHNLLETLRGHANDEIEITGLTELVRQRMLTNAWRELPQAKCQEPYLVLEGRSLRLRIGIPNSASPSCVPKAPPVKAAEELHRPAPQEVPPARIKDPWTNDVGICFRLIRPGSFAMGASASDSAAPADEQPRTIMAIPRPFWAATFPLTNAVIHRFLQSGKLNDDPRFAKLRGDRSFAAQLRQAKAADNVPAVEVSHDDAEILCAWLHSLDGRHYRLPVEAEWEYMARAGTTGPYWWKDQTAANDCAVFAGAGPAPADSGRANGLGLIDVLGNVAEWTASAYDRIDSGAATRAADSLCGDARVARGGSWRAKTIEDLRVSRRKSMFRRTRADDLGVRIVCDFDPAADSEEKHENWGQFVEANQQSAAPTAVRQEEPDRKDLVPLVTATVKKVVQTLKATLGPCGRAMPLSVPMGIRTTTHGWEVLANLASDDPSEQAIIRLMSEAMKTRRSFGDGATRTAILAGEMFLESVPALAVGQEWASVQRGIEKAAKAVATYLAKAASKVDVTIEMVKGIGTMAAGGDTAVGDELANALEKVGSDGVVYAKAGIGTQTRVEVFEGIQFDSGYLSPHFVTDPDEMQCVLEDAYILIHEGRLSNVKELMPLLEAVVKAERPILIVADEVDGAVLETLVANKSRGTLKCCAVPPPGDGSQRKAMLQDLAILVGGTALFESTERKLGDLALTDLGRAGRTVIGQSSTTIIGGAGKQLEIGKRVEELRHQIETSNSDDDREKFMERLAKLAGGVAVVDVGGASEREIRTKTILVRDAMKAIRAACESGVLAGGGVPLARTAALLETARSRPEQVPGIQAVAQALRMPLRTIVKNAGIDPEEVLRTVCAHEGFIGFDVVNRRLTDLRSVGIVDPAEVLIAAVSNAATIACRLIDHASQIDSARTNRHDRQKECQEPKESRL